MANTKKQNLSLNEFIAKVQNLGKQNEMDLSSGEDLSVGLMNLISIEEHLFFTANKTGKSEYYDMLAEIRKIRQAMLRRLIKDYEGEVWCISKHLLAASMRLMEVGTKALDQGKKDDAADLFNKAYQLYNLFWGLNLGIVKSDDLEKVEDSGEKKTEKNKSAAEEISFISEGKKPEVSGKSGVFDKLGQIVTQMVNCCRE